MTIPAESDLDYLASKSERPLPEFMLNLPSGELSDLKDFVENVIFAETAGLDRFFKTVSISMAYIPNFVLHAVTKKYIDPPISAKITKAITLKQAVGVANGLPAEYVVEVAAHQDPETAAEIVENLKPKLRQAIMRLMPERHLLKGLDIAVHLSPKARAELAATYDFSTVDESVIQAPHHLHILEELKN